MTSEDHLVGCKRVKRGDNVGKGFRSSVRDPISEFVFRHGPTRCLHALRNDVLDGGMVS